MSSLSDHEVCIPKITPALSIPELIKVIKHSFRECEFDEVQNILIDREKKMKIEIEDVKRDLDSIKKEARLLERSQSLLELEKLRLEEKLQWSRRKCEELNETITRLTEERRVFSDRAKRAEEYYEKVSQESSKTMNEKNKLIFELNEKINELKNKNLENERLVGQYQEKLKCVDTKIVEMGRDIEDLRHGKLAANQTVEELRWKQVETDRVVEELKCQNLELSLEKMECNKAAELYKDRLENLAPRVLWVEAELASILNVKVEDLSYLITTMKENVDLPDSFKGGKDSSRNGRRKADAEDVAALSPGERYTSNSTGSGGIGKSKKGGRNLVNSRTKEDGGNTIRTTPGSQSGCNPFGVESNDSAQRNEGEDPQVSGFGAQHSSKKARSSSAVGNVIEISDSDGET